MFLYLLALNRFDNLPKSIHPKFFDLNELVLKKFYLLCSYPSRFFFCSFDASLRGPNQ